MFLIFSKILTFFLQYCRLLCKRGKKKSVFCLLVEQLTLQNPPILGYSSFSHPFTLEIGASATAIGSILCQRINFHGSLPMQVGT